MACRICDSPHGCIHTNITSTDRASLEELAERLGGLDGLTFEEHFQPKKARGHRARSPEAQLQPELEPEFDPEEED